MNNILQLLAQLAGGGQGGGNQGDTTTAATPNASSFSMASGGGSALGGLAGSGFGSTSASGATSGQAGGAPAGSVGTGGGSAGGNLGDSAAFAALGQPSPIGLPSDIQAQIAQINPAQFGFLPWAQLGANLITPWNSNAFGAPQGNTELNWAIANAAGINPSQISGLTAQNQSQYPQWALQALYNLQSSELPAPPSNYYRTMKEYQDTVTQSPLYQQLIAANLAPWYYSAPPATDPNAGG